jgi:drug/metabolite transporter (DMT)-like permease
VREKRAVAAWAALGIIWGSNFIFMKWASDYLSPSEIVLARVALGFLPVMLYAVFMKQLRLHHVRHAGHFLVMACLAAAIYYYGFARGTSLLPSGIAGAVSGAIPLFAMIAAVLFLPEEKLSKSKVAGLVVGFVGVLLIARPFDADLDSASLEGALFMTLGSLSLGISFVYARKYVMPLGIPAAALTTYQLGMATVLLMVFTDTGNLGSVAASPKALWGLVAGLGLLGTGVAYIIDYYIVDKMGAVRASSVTYLPPVVALAIGALLVGEPISSLDYLAAALILAGVLLLNLRVRGLL